jgi:uncharacterized protein (DUF488 family)
MWENIISRQSMMSKKEIFTIGHSTHSIEFFIDLLKKMGITCVVDVRSVAASRYNPQFNKSFLSAYLKNKDILYLHFDKEFGARQTDPNVLDSDNKVDFEKVQASLDFENGVKRLEQGLAKGFNIALMCSEADPLDCHRFVMITAALKDKGFSIKHILKDQTLLDNTELETALLTKFAKKLPKPTIFEPDVTPEMQLKAAYKLRNKQIAWSPDKDEEADNERL